jgi:hypothetical protein
MKDPDRHIPPSLFLRHVLWIEFQGASTRRDIHIMSVDPEPPIATVNFITQIQDYDDWRCEIVTEESLGTWVTANRLAWSECQFRARQAGK